MFKTKTKLPAHSIAIKDLVDGDVDAMKQGMHIRIDEGKYKGTIVYIRDLQATNPDPKKFIEDHMNIQFTFDVIYTEHEKLKRKIKGNQVDHPIVQKFSRLISEIVNDIVADSRQILEEEVKEDVKREQREPKIIGADGGKIIGAEERDIILPQ